jgi:anti-sigma regulatory factor (Ser/Thr protein kinase)
LSESLRLELPARPEVLSLVRLQVGGVAAMLGMGLGEIEDLQLGTEELCLSRLPLEGRLDGRLVVEVEWDGESVSVRCTADGASSGRPPAAFEGDDALPEGVSDQILDALVDEHGTLVEGTRVVAWLRTRRIPPPG